GRDRADVLGCRCRYHRRIGRPDQHRGAAHLWPDVPDPLQRPYPQRGGACHHGCRQYHRGRSGERHPAGWPGRSGLSRPTASDRSLLDAACGHRGRGRRDAMALALSGGPQSGAAPAQPRTRGAPGMTSVAGKRVLITGGGTGVGADLARAFAGAGAEVVICGRRMAPLQAVSERTGVRAVTADVTDEASVKAMFAEAGPCDIVIANAGAADSAPLGRTSLDQWNAMLAVNLTGTFLTFREGLAQLPGWGRLIAVRSEER